MVGLRRGQVAEELQAIYHEREKLLPLQRFMRDWVVECHCLDEHRRLVEQFKEPNHG
jgi:hypothetical protein